MKEKIGVLIKNYWEAYFPASAGKDQNFFTALNLSILFLMAIFIFVNPLLLSSVSNLSLYLSLLFLIILLIFKKTDFTLRTPLTLPFALFFFWAVFGLFFALDFNNSLNDIRSHLLKYLIAFFLLINYFNSQKRLEILSWLVISSTTIFTIGAIIYFYFVLGEPFTARLGTSRQLLGYKGFGDMFTGIMCYAIIFSITLILHYLYRSKSKTVKILLGVCVFILTVATILNQSRGAVIALFISLVILSIINKKTLIFVLAAVILIIAMPGFRDRVESRGLFTDVRTKMYRLTIEVIKDYPITGVGFGMQIYPNAKLVNLRKYNEKLPEKYQQKPWWIINTPHNTYLDIAVRTGIVGLIFFLSVLLIAVLMLWRIWRKSRNDYHKSWAVCLLASLASFLTLALFSDATYGSRAVLLYIILSMIVILWNLAKKETSEI
ncbi:MAG TPA: hypothetical protein ENN23_09530 [Deltaproteobacteria bacterium]|nr:hypothetical protein [Deltaproteobacteria bacterium]